MTGSWWRTTVRFEALERFLPSFRGPHASAGFRVFGAAMTYIAYLDEFGHIGPYIARDDPRILERVLCLQSGCKLINVQKKSMV